MTVKNKKKWCYWQCSASDLKGFVCMASSASGHVFECTYKEDGEWVHRGTLNHEKWVSPIHPTGGGVCEDYKTCECAKKNKNKETAP